ncbi:MAG: RIP metalloprotease RseP [Balneolaceae bacterium]|nr:RIP metalloprotease RseP [Balneolaceae bacterium]
MEWFLDIGTTIGIFAAALLILVFFHELGHFLAAKLFGMRVERFSLGFPPRIWGFKKGETDYCIGATPLGGYVKISGMIDESMDTEHLDEEIKPWEYRAKPVWQRMIVITAGVIFNMILAVMIFAGIALSNGETKVKLDSVKSIYVQEGSVADNVGFETGDQIVGVNGEKVTYFNELFTPSRITGDNLTYTVSRNGEEIVLAVPDSALNQINKEGFISLVNAWPSKISDTSDGDPADEAGIQAGDRITAINGSKVNYWMQVVEGINASEDSVQLEVARGIDTLSFNLALNSQNQLGILGPDQTKEFDIERFDYGLFASLGVGWNRTEETFTGIIQGFGKMFSGDISVKENLGGPVAIASITKQATEQVGQLAFGISRHF